MDLMAARRRILMDTGEFIPPGYQQYDYLKTNQYKSYIDTGVPGDNTLQLDFTFSPLYSSSWAPIFGNYDGNRNNLFWGMRQTDSNKYLQLFAGCASIANQQSVHFDESVIGRKIEVSLGYASAKFTIDGTEYSPSLTEYSGTASNLNIFIGNFATTQAYGTTNAFYKIRITKNGKAIRNYIPVVRKSDSRAGFYDTVNCTFNPSIGASDFTAGNDA